MSENSWSTDSKDFSLANATGDLSKVASILPTGEIHPDSLKDVKQEPADDSYSGDQHVSCVEVRADKLLNLVFDNLEIFCVDTSPLNYFLLTNNDLGNIC